MNNRKEGGDMSKRIVKRNNIDDELYKERYEVGLEIKMRQKTERKRGREKD